MKKIEIENMSVAELEVRLIELRKNYAELKSAHVMSPIQNPLQIRTVRRSIARVNTEITKKRLQQL